MPGVLIVVMAVMLDRTTTAASERSEKVARGGGGNLRVRRIDPRPAPAWRRWSRSTCRARDLSLAEFPEYTVGERVADAADDAMA